jgi:hypothetical protein
VGWPLQTNALGALMGTLGLPSAGGGLGVPRSDLSGDARLTPAEESSLRCVVSPAPALVRCCCVYPCAVWCRLPPRLCDVSRRCTLTHTVSHVGSLAWVCALWCGARALTRLPASACLPVCRVCVGGCRALLLGLEDRIRTRGVEVTPAFQDFDRLRKGVVPVTQFRRTMDKLGACWWCCAASCHVLLVCVRTAHCVAVCECSALANFTCANGSSVVLARPHPHRNAALQSGGGHCTCGQLRHVFHAQSVTRAWGCAVYAFPLPGLGLTDSDVALISRAFAAPSADRSEVQYQVRCAAGTGVWAVRPARGRFYCRSRPDPCVSLRCKPVLTMKRVFCAIVYACACATVRDRVRLWWYGHCVLPVVHCRH